MDCTQDNGQMKRETSCCRIRTKTGGCLYGKFNAYLTKIYKEYNPDPVADE